MKKTSEAYNKQSESSKRYTANHDLSSESSDSAICSSKQTKIQKLNETLYSPICGSVMKKKEGYFCPQKCVKNKKFECGYLTLIKKLLE